MQAFPAPVLGSWPLGEEVVSEAVALSLSVDLKRRHSRTKPEISSSDFAGIGSRDTVEDEVLKHSPDSHSHIRHFLRLIKAGISKFLPSRPGLTIFKPHSLDYKPCDPARVLSKQPETLWMSG